MQKRLILKTPRYFRKRHKHNEACAAERVAIGYVSVLFSIFNDLLTRDRVCAKHELKKLAQKSGELYKKYLNMQWRQRIHSQKATVHGSANQEESASSSRYSVVHEHLESTTASSSTPLKNTSSFRYGSVSEHLENTAASSSGAPLLGQRTAVVFNEGVDVRRKEDSQSTAELFQTFQADLFREHNRIA